MKDIETELYIYGKRATYETIKDIVEQLEAYRKLGTPEELAELKAENERLKKRLENTVVLPCLINVSSKYAVIVDRDKNGQLYKTHSYPKQAAEARLKELQEVK